MVVGDAKMVAKTLTVSDAMQGFPDVVTFPLIIISWRDWLSGLTTLVCKCYKLFKHLFS